MQTEAEAFLKRIRAFPDDDPPRLIFADWLEEQGDSAGPAWGSDRAKFIRVQIALARLAEEDADPTVADSPGRAERDETRKRLREAENELLAAHEAEWTAPFRVRGLASGAVFRRGFVEKVNVEARTFAHRAPELFEAGPLRHVQLLNIGESYAAALQCPFLGRLNALTVHGQHKGEPLARAVARSPYLTGLKSLALTRNRFEDGAAELLASSPVLTNLEELDLSENELGETGAWALAASPHLANVRRLELSGNRVGPGGAEVLAGSERLASLCRLGLAGNEVGTARLHSLVRAHDLLRLPTLVLSANAVTAAGLLRILTRPPGPTEPGAVRLREIDLSHNELGNEGARVLAASPHLAGLKVLRLAGCGIGDHGARALAESPHLNQLVSLDLGNNPIGDPGFRTFLTTPHMRGLRNLVTPTAGVSAALYLTLGNRYNRNRG